jgi:hypothetical protein
MNEKEHEIDIDELLDRHEKICNEALRQVFPARDIGIQEDTRDNLLNIHDEVRTAKRAAINTKNEELANLLLGCQCIAKALAQEINCWILIKSGEPHKAWASLVDAQENAILSSKTPAASDCLTQCINRLFRIEEIAFPSLVFVSSGLTHDRGKCSICGSFFEDCDHVEGLIYCGQVCAEIGFTRVTADDVAIVESPRDKRCYVQNIEGEDTPARDTLSGKPVKIKSKDSSSTRGMRMDAIVLVNSLPVGVEP